MSNFAYANDEPVIFENKNLEERYYFLIEEIRCLVCQNQSLADSNAPLAQDLRNEISMNAQLLFEKNYKASDWAKELILNIKSI